MRARRGTWTGFGCLLIVAALTACYESSAPLSPAGQVPRDAALTGKWRCVEAGAKPGETITLEVFPFDDAQYYAEWTDARETSRIRAYGSRAGDVTVLNFREIEAGSEAGKWMFLRYGLEAPKTLKLSVVSESALKGLSETGALEAIRKRAADDALYEPWTVCSREAE